MRLATGAQQVVALPVFHQPGGARVRPEPSRSAASCGRSNRRDALATTRNPHDTADVAVQP